MRKVLIVMILTSLGVVSGCGDSTNPFFTHWDTPFQVPPFDQIETEHFEPAFTQGMQAQAREIQDIVQLKAEPSFGNTVEALDRSGLELARVSQVFFALNGSMTNEAMQAVAKDISPRLSRHRDEILLNSALFARIDAVFQQRNDLVLEPEQDRLLTETHKRFVRGGARLDDTAKAQLKTFNEKLSLLTLAFGEHVLKEVNTFVLLVDDEADLAGLPTSVIAAAAEAAATRDHAGQWAFTLDKPSLIPFLQYAENRTLRETMYKAYINQGDNNNDLDNKALLKQIVDLRLQKANLLGYDSHAHYVLSNNMAKEPQAVYELLQAVWEPALARAQEEVDEFQKMIEAQGGNFQLAAWDWWYYAEKVKKARYDLDEEMLRPYFSLDKARSGMFAVATKLWGLTFHPRQDIPVYQDDVKAYEVKEADGTHVAVLYLDYFPRASKRGGAWMDAFRKQYKADGENVRPVIFNVGNFTKPSGDRPALLSLDELTTMFHEFGHALHGMLSDCTYRSLSGTAVARDFVELPSQIMENWALEPEVLALYAQHYETGQQIPLDLVKKIKEASHFNQGFVTTEYVAASFLDLDWHTVTDANDITDANTFEAASLGRIGLIDEIASRYRSPYFRHIFAGGYSAGYYAYMWAEVLDADAFEAFKESGDIFDAQTALSFRSHILERGGTVEAGELYHRFRGQQPDIQPLLKRRGLD